MHTFSTTDEIYLDCLPFVFEWTTPLREVYASEGRGDPSGKNPLKRSITFHVQPLTHDQADLINRNYVIGVFRKLSLNMYVYCHEWQTLVDHITQKFPGQINSRTIFQLNQRIVTYKVTKNKAKITLHKTENCLYVWNFKYQRLELDPQLQIKGLSYQFHSEIFLKSSGLAPLALRRTAILQLSDLDPEQELGALEFIAILTATPGLDVSRIASVLMAEQGTSISAFYSVQRITQFPVGTNYYIVFDSSVASVNDSTFQDVIEHFIMNGHPRAQLDRPDSLPGRTLYPDIFPPTAPLPQPTKKAWKSPAASSEVSTITSSTSDSTPRQKMQRLGSPTPQTTQTQPDSVTERFGNLDITPRNQRQQSPPRRAVFIPYVPPAPRLTSTNASGSFTPMQIRVPRTQPMTTASQPHVSDSQPPDPMDDEDDL
jgi:hypothetical protein